MPGDFKPGGNRPRRAPRHIDPYKPSGERETKPDDDGESGTIEGKNAVLEALRAGIPLDKVYIVRGDADSTIMHIAGAARQAGAVVVDADRRKLDALSVTHAHQGVVALVSAAPYVDIDAILARAGERGEKPLIIVCDEISDPHNLGAIIRTAEASGAHGVIIPKRRSAGLTAIVGKTSAGAAFHLPIARVSNINDALRDLKKAGVWVFGSAPDAEKTVWESDLRESAAIVIGSEGEGMGRLVRENCDFLVRIPMSGKISSLNASVSAAVLMYEAVRQRSGG
jgi:23S rRNA (guanosine2251-2'-O)-methyltransferase